MNRLQTGALLTDLFSIFFANIVPFVLIAAIAMVPWVLVFLTDPADLLTQSLASILQYALGQLATAAITLGVYNRLRGKSVSVGECVATALKRGIPVLLAGILAGLAIGIAMLMLVVPGLIVATMLFVALPVVVVERRGVLDAFNRSTELSSGHRWPIFFLLLFFFMISALGGLLSGIGMLSVGPSGIFVQLVVQILVTTLNAVAAALVYYRLREVKENLDLEQVAEVFA